MNKKAQLGMIEIKFFMMGLLAGMVLLYILMALAKRNILPFPIPVL